MYHSRRDDQLFYILGACYTLLFLLISLVLRRAPLGLTNWGDSPARIVGWVSFVAIESYGSLAVALFWAFTNATVDLEAAKASYGLVIAGAQIGAIIGRRWRGGGWVGGWVDRSGRILPRVVVRMPRLRPCGQRSVCGVSRQDVGDLVIEPVPPAWVS